MDKKLKERIEGANEALYINLGKGGRFAHECIKNGYMMVYFPDVPHAQIINDIDSVPSKHRNTLRRFYEETDAIWVTSWNMRLWWAFAKGKAFPGNKDAGFRKRKVIGWHDTSLTGGVLYHHNLGYLPRGKHTISRVNPASLGYLKSSICGTGAGNDEKCLIARLDENQLEWLIAKLFREEGWKQVSPVGGTQEDIDLVVEKGKRTLAFIQAKIGGTMGNWAEVFRLAYRFSSTGASENRNVEFYLVYSNPPPDEEMNLSPEGLADFSSMLLEKKKLDPATHGENLEAVKWFSKEGHKVSVRHLGPEFLAKMAVKHGLSNWLKEQVN